MQIYISWSGQTSFRMARLLRELIKEVLPDQEPWVSAEDIEEGARWSPDLIRILDQSTFCIICADPTNFLSHWLHFEAGAIVKVTSKWHIRIYLNELKPGDLKGPFRQFQSVKLEKNDTRRMFEDLHANYEEESITHLEMMARFEDAWPGFQEKVNQLKAESSVKTDDGKVSEEKDESTPLAYIDEVDEKILALLCVNDGIEEEKIAMTVYLTRTVCMHHLIELEKKELVWSSLLFGVRRWYITDLGKKYLPAFYQG